ncbi:hypothetical protein L3X38_013178 [Prunus dulcis]|uniref:Uncharacterized protein n=1 Tax=Prunus dulcis TaxID=3755 RepID=A0AAD4WN92_PRUDU|nr:hypothetical protein L3X38_013178 [Prunus dulcis]
METIISPSALPQLYPRAMVLYVMDTKFYAKFGNTDPSSLVTITSPWRRGCGPCGGRHGRLAIEVPNSAQPNTNL